MKKMLTTLMMVLIAVQLFAMSNSTIRSHARFLSDRMAFELDLTPYQYDDVYEINYDFIHSIDRIMDDVVYGYRDAIDQYYRLLDYRNEDLRFVLNRVQFNRFLASDYFYRPVYSTGRGWAFRIYTIYSNRSFFYFDAPSVYRHYRGAHSHVHFNHNYYSGRYHHNAYGDAHHHIMGSPRFNEHGRNDFGANRRERGNHRENEINNYSNQNQHNRTHDPRYRDNSGNRNSPKINHRGQDARPDNGSTRREHGAQSSPTPKRENQRGQNARPDNGSTRREHGAQSSPTPKRENRRQGGESVRQGRR